MNGNSLLEELDTIGGMIKKKNFGNLGVGVVNRTASNHMEYRCILFYIFLFYSFTKQIICEITWFVKI